MMRVIGFSPGLRRRVDMLNLIMSLHVDEVDAPMDIYSCNHVEELVTQWIVSPDKVFSHEACDVDDPMRETIAEFWTNPELNELLELITDDEYTPIAIDVLPDDRYILDLELKVEYYDH